MRRILTLMIFILAFSSTCLAYNWQEVEKDETAKYYIDTETIGKNPVSGWVKITYEDKAAREQYINELKNLVKEIDWSNFYYTCDKVEYKTENGELMFRRLCNIFYDSKDGLIFANDYPSPWEKVTPGTVGEIMYKALSK